MTSKTDLRTLIEFVEEYANEEELESPYGVRAILDDLEKDLEVLEIIKKVGIISLVFDEDPYCNLVLTDKDLIDIDYDGHAPDIEMTYEEYKKIMEWLKKNDKK